MGRSIHQRKECLMKNMEFVGFDDLNGKPGFQMAMQNEYSGLDDLAVR